jgi:hypothetical protein
MILETEQETLICFCSNKLLYFLSQIGENELQFKDAFSRVVTKSNSAYNMMNVVRAAGCQSVNFFVSAQYLKNEMSDLNETWYTYAWW